MRKICVVTSSRADYGIMYNLIEKIEHDKDLQLQLVVTGSHLFSNFGNTINEITQFINRKIKIGIEKGASFSIGLTIEKFSKYFDKIKPDIVVILGDRYEIFAVAVSSMLNNIPIAHIHGGETTQGAIDEAIRHSITKMSHLHFASCEEYKKRIVQLGENPKTVFNVGSLSVENIEKMEFLNAEELKIDLNKKNLLITYHPVTIGKEDFEQVLSALRTLTDTNLIFTKPNADKGNEKISKLIDNFVKLNKNAICHTSMGALRYLSTMRLVNGVLGNSSSAILEAPSFKIGTINIGDRQKGRIQAKSIINCKCEKEDILKAIKKLYSKKFQNNLIKVQNVYKQKNTSDKIIKILKTYDLDNILKKEFYDL